MGREAEEEAWEERQVRRKRGKGGQGDAKEKIEFGEMSRYIVGGETKRVINILSK